MKLPRTCEHCGSSVTHYGQCECQKPRAVEILCKEIGYRFDKRMETPATLAAFVKVLVSQVDDIRRHHRFMANHGGPPPTAEADETFNRVHLIFGQTTIDGLIKFAAEAHDYIHTVHSDEGPCDHLIDMLSSCVSAIRFGLEIPCHSRHASEAAGHIWKHLYGVRLFDSYTSAWQHDWTRSKLQEAILLQTGEIKPLQGALRDLVMHARTSGGTAGRDDGLCAACDRAEIILQSKI